MKFLKCIICNGEVDIVDSDRSSNKKIKCRKCGFANGVQAEAKSPEIIIIRRRQTED